MTRLLAVVRALPAISFTPVVIVAVYDVEAAREELGLKVAVLASVVLNDTVPEIRVPALFFKVYVDVVTVELCTASLNVATIEELTGTPIAPPAGLALITVGGVVSMELLAT